jgi:hypothetical protein
MNDDDDSHHSNHIRPEMLNSLEAIAIRKKETNNEESG